MLVAEQTSMMPDNEQPRPLMSLEMIARIAREAAGAAAEAAVSKTLEQLGLPFKAADQPEVKPKAKASPRRMIADWNTYRGFRRNMSAREKLLLETNEPPLDKKPFAHMSDSGGDTERNILRVMHWYHLDPKRHWPPSTWPEQEPPCPVNCKVHHPLRRALTLAGAAVVAVLGARELLGNVIHFCRHLAGLT